MSLSVAFGHEFRDGYCESILDSHDYAGFEPILLVPILIRVLNSHLDCHDGFTCIHCFRIYACAIERSMELGIVIILIVIANDLGSGFPLKVGSLLVIKVPPLVMVNTSRTILIYQLG